MRLFYRRLWRLGKWTVSLLLILIITLLATLWFLLGTEKGYRQLPELLNRFTPLTVQYGELQGQLLGTQRWQNLHITGMGMDMRFAELELALNWQDVLHRRVHIHDLHVKDVSIDLPRSENSAPRESAGIPEQLPQLGLPVDIIIEALSLENVRLSQAGTPLTTIEQANLHGEWLRNGEVQLEAALNMAEVEARLRANGQLRETYPLELHSEGTLHLPALADTDFDVTMSGSVLAPQLVVKSTGALEADVRLDGEVDLKVQTLDIAAQWENIAYGEDVHARAGDLRMAGTFSDWTLLLEGEVGGKEIPPAHIRLDSHLNQRALDKIDLVVDVLGGEIALQGKVDFADALAWQGRLQLQGIDGKKFREDLDLRLDGDIRSEGRWQDGKLLVNADIAHLQGSWQTQPIVGHGGVAVKDNAVQVNDFLFEIAGNRIVANGSVGETDADLQVDLVARELHRLVPIIRGDITANGTVRGNIGDPELDVRANWRGLRVGEDIVTDSSGTAQAQGRWQALAISVDAKASGRDFPAVEAKGSTQLRLGDGTGSVEDIDLVLKGLEGTVAAKGRVEFLPDVRWDVQTTGKGLNPQHYVSGLQGKVDAVIHAQGSVVAGKLEMVNDLQQLGGQWQGQALSGKGEVRMAQGKLLLDAVKLSVGNNQLEADGQIDGETLDVRFAIDGKNLAAFYPELRGQLNGQGQVQGKATAPQIVATLQGSNLAFADYQMARLDAKLDSHLQGQGALNNTIRINQLHAAGQSWNEILLETTGRFDAHELRLRASGGEINGELAARGGLQDFTAWRGTLERLQVEGQDMAWALQQPSALNISPQALSLKAFCLADRYSGLCVDVEHEQETQIRYDIRKLDPQSFAAFIPDTVTIGTALSGNGNIRRDRAGNILGEASITAEPGRIVIRPPKQAPITLPLREGKLETAFTANEARSRLNVDFAESGTVDATLVVKDYRALNLDGRVQLQVPDIGRFAYLVPKVSELKGKVEGDLLIGGNAAQPQISGEIALENGAVIIPEYATELRDIRLDIKAERSGQLDINGKIGTPEGHLDANGVLHLSPLQMDLKLAGERMLLANAKTLRVLASPKFDITIDPDSGIVIEGQVDIPEASIDIPDTSGGESISEDVVIVTETHESPAEIVAEPSSAPLRATIAVRLGDKVFFANKDMKIRLKGGLDIGIRPGQPVSGRGTIEVASGYYELYGQELNIQRGRANFTGNIANPSVEVLAMREVADVEVGARVSGTAQNLRLDLTSEPGMPDSAILSYLLFGRAPDGAMDSEALMQTAAGVGLKGIMPGDLAGDTGLDVFDVGISGLKAGKYLSEDIYVGMRSNFFTGVTEFLARYQFNSRMSMELSSEGSTTAIDFLYQFEKD